MVFEGRAYRALVVILEAVEAGRTACSRNAEKGCTTEQFASRGRRPAGKLFGPMGGAGYPVIFRIQDQQRGHGWRLGDGWKGGGLRPLFNWTSPYSVSEADAWPATITWSRVRTSTSSSACLRRLVSALSASLGSGCPIGWLWEKNTAAALRRRASFTTSRGYTEAASIVPRTVDVLDQPMLVVQE